MVKQISGGFWYQNHCLKVTPQKKGGSVRYRYPGEEWTLVDGDDYQVSDNKLGQCSGAYYQVSGETQEYHSARPNEPISTFIALPIIQVRRILNPSSPFHFDSPYPGHTDLFQRAYIKYIDLNGQEREHSTYGAANALWKDKQPSNIQIYRTNRNGRPFPPGNDNCGNCRLTILNDGKIVHEEEREECPEVEKTGDKCVEDESTKVEVRTSPLGQIWVSQTTFSLHGGLLGDLPDECIHIYNMVPYIPIGGAPSLGNNSLTSQILSFVGEYCSEKGCNHPTVERLGDDCKESCPDGTCAVICSDHACCADPRTGRIIQEIPLSEYKGGGK